MRAGSIATLTCSPGTAWLVVSCVCVDSCSTHVLAGRAPHAPRATTDASSASLFIEQRPHAIDEPALADLRPALAAHPRELLDQLALPRRELGRHVDLHGD